MGFTADYMRSLLARTHCALKNIIIIFHSIRGIFGFLSCIALVAVAILIISSLLDFSKSSLRTKGGIDFENRSITHISGRIYDFEKQNIGDIFYGKWVYDETYPLYNASNCPFVEPDLRCQTNGRPDRGYTKLKWQPWGTTLPLFNASRTLSKLQNKRVAFIGDSMGRTQWESLICMIMEGVNDIQSVQKLKQNGHVKRVKYLGAHFSSFNLTIEYYRAPFLVERGTPLKGVSNGIRAALRLDKLVSSKLEWQDAQVLVFNSAHWWTPTKIFDKNCYFEISGNINLLMNIEDAYRMALKTWAAWIEKNVNPMKTRVFFRSYEPAHLANDTSSRSCYLQTQPTNGTLHLDGQQFGQLNKILYKVVHAMKFDVTILNVTESSAYRIDAHVGSWSTSPSILDCSHWCLPGVPDIWNELLLLSYLG